MSYFEHPRSQKDTPLPKWVYFYIWIYPYSRIKVDLIILSNKENINTYFKYLAWTNHIKILKQVI